MLALSLLSQNPQNSRCPYPNMSVPPSSNTSFAKGCIVLMLRGWTTKGLLVFHLYKQLLGFVFNTGECVATCQKKNFSLEIGFMGTEVLYRSHVLCVHLPSNAYYFQTTKLSMSLWDFKTIKCFLVMDRIWMFL